MHTYLYDGSFDGLLTAYFYAYKDSSVQNICRETDWQPDLLSQPVPVSMEPDKARRVLDSVQKKLSSYTARNLYLLYLSELPGCDLLGLKYLRLCYQQGAGINLAKHHPVIHQVEDIRRKVLHEYDHMKGFLRFQQIDRFVYFARFAPDHNQLPLLIPHLERRFSDQKMIVYDEKRSLAMLYNLEHSILVPFTASDAEQIAGNSSDDFIHLFRQYFQAINIPERANPKQQAGYMPHRYRRYMPETSS
ncbi:MAG: TIGR03915 family putative DNA repair protein [Peptococcaceae bacterium]|nr:TIGR03915 family putative DNA repair protein [Peptococcaceae bacterium]